LAGQAQAAEGGFHREVDPVEGVAGRIMGGQGTASWPWGAM
jgi:hypothetical protein